MFLTSQFSWYKNQMHSQLTITKKSRTHRQFSNKKFTCIRTQSVLIQTFSIYKNRNCSKEWQKFDDVPAQPSFSSKLAVNGYVLWNHIMNNWHFSSQIIQYGCVLCTKFQGRRLSPDSGCGGAALSRRQRRGTALWQSECPDLICYGIFIDIRRYMQVYVNMCKYV